MPAHFWTQAGRARRRLGWLSGVRLGLTLVLLAVAVGLVLWHLLSGFAWRARDHSLQADLRTLDMIFTAERNALDDALALIAADPKLQTTATLTTAPQLGRHITDLGATLGLDSLAVVDLDGRRVATLGAELLAGCAPGQGTAVGETADGRLFLTQVHDLMAGGRPMGRLCGGIGLNGPALTHRLGAGVPGRVAFAWGGQIQVDGDPRRFESDPAAPDGTPTNGRLDGERVLGVWRPIALANGELRLGVLVPRAETDRDLLTLFLGVMGTLAVFLAAAALASGRFRVSRGAQARLQQEQARAAGALASIADAVLTTDRGGLIRYANAAAGRILARAPSQLIGHPWGEVLSGRDESTGAPLEDLISGAASSPTHPSVQGIAALSAGRGVLDVHYRITPAEAPDAGAGATIVLRDLGEERRLQRQLEWQATHDQLTGLINRIEFKRRVSLLIEAHHQDQPRPGRAGSPNAGRTGGQTRSQPRGETGLGMIAHLDLDRFKVVNDSCGHHQGDLILRKVGETLAANLPAGADLARLAGDEFALLLPGYNDRTATRACGRLIEALGRERYGYGERTFELGVSIGLVNLDRATQDLDGAMASADAACAIAKAQGRNRVHVYRPDQDQAIALKEQMLWVPRIQEALRRGSFELFAQPIVGLNRPARHDEILIRMQDGDGGLISPGIFLPVAERYGLMHGIDRWVIDTLFANLGPTFRAAARERPCGMPFSINLSGPSLQDPGFMAFIEDAIARHDIPPQTLCFEVTETVAITYLDTAERLMQNLRERGVKFMLDDFGSGMSSFGYLKSLPVEYLKIDGQFVRDLLSNPVDRELVRAMTEIAHLLDLETVAEFVETHSVADLARELGVDYAQGYAYGKPRPLISVGQGNRLALTGTPAPRRASSGRG